MAFITQDVPTRFPLLLGIPDTSHITVNPGPDGGARYQIDGNCRFVTELSDAARQRLISVVFGPGIPIRIPPPLQAQGCINAIADVDQSSIALRMLEAHLETNGLGCFNHPTAVSGTSRERVAEKLAGIDGINMPRTIRLRIDEPADLPGVAASRDLRWPLIVRLAGTHRGIATVRIDDPQQVREGLRSMAWGGRDLYLTEYVDCRDADGKFRKLRVAVVGREVFIRHFLIADGWMVHADDRDMGHLREEERMLSTFRSGLLPELAVRLRAVTEAIDLDYFGIDCNLRPDGRLVVYEVNALMDIVNNTMRPATTWDGPISVIRDALTSLLFDPTRWRHPQPVVVPA